MFIADEYEANSIDGQQLQIIEKLNTNQKISSSQVWNLIAYLDKNPATNLPKDGILQMLNCNEVFIRNRVALVVLKHSFSTNFEVLKTIFGDEHPSVIFEGIKGAILGFPDYTEEEQGKIKPYLITALSNPFVVIRASNLLTTFAIDYGSESINWNDLDEEKKKARWNLWGELFPIFLNNYPENLRFSNSGRFGATLNESEKYISGAQGLNICNTYYNWLDRFLETRVPDTHEFGLLPYLLKVTDGDKGIRFDLFKKIFTHTDTHFVTYSLAWCIDAWERLTQEEIDYILNLLRGGRNDTRWLLAVSLTQYHVPKEIQNIIFGNPDQFKEDIEVIIRSLDPKLLHDCLNVFCGYPQPLSWLGLSNNGNTLWFKIIKWILTNKHPVGFDICLEENKTDYTFKAGKSILEFFPADSAAKLRGARRHVLFINECNNVDYESFLQLDVRTRKHTILDFNPVRRFWVHDKLIPSLQDNEHLFVKSTYTDNRFLTAEEKANIERRRNNANWWKIYGEGEIGTTEGLIFNNWSIIQTPSISSLPNREGERQETDKGVSILPGNLLGYGLDFGFSHSPTALVQVNEFNGELYVRELLYRSNMQNDEIFDFAQKNIDLKAMTIADSAEPKSISYLRYKGWHGLKAAEKGPDSVMFGINLLLDRKINVTRDSLNLIKELRQYMWDTNHDGEFVQRPVKDFDHAIDALRYVYSEPKKRKFLFA